jgi:hypothetical protein
MRTLLLPWLCLCLFLGFTATAATAGELGMKATLIWGTDEEKPADTKIKPVSPELAKRLRGIFKWKHYFEVKAENASIQEKATKKFILSSKCTVEVKNDAKTYNAKLWGEGKLLKAIDQPVKAGEDMVLAGDDKNMTAWFVILTPQ